MNQITIEKLGIGQQTVQGRRPLKPEYDDQENYRTNEELWQRSIYTETAKNSKIFIKRCDAFICSIFHHGVKFECLVKDTTKRSGPTKVCLFEFNVSLSQQAQLKERLKNMNS